MKVTFIYSALFLFSTTSFLEATGRDTNFNLGNIESELPEAKNQSVSLSQKGKDAAEEELSDLISSKDHPEVYRSLQFLDDALPKDELNFLRTKYPQLVKKSKEVKRENNYLKELGKNFPDSKNPTTTFIEYVKSNLYVAIYDPRLYILCNLQEDYAAARREIELFAVNEQLKREATPYEKFILKQKLDPNRYILENIVLAAEQIETTLLRYGHAPVLFLGRTPCFIQVSYEEICKQKQPEIPLPNHIFHLSFSGTPDTMNLRDGADYQEEERNTLRNMLTPEKLAFYENYMTKKGLNNIGDKLYLVDMLGSGGSLNSFLRILRHYYECVLERNMPDVHFICLNLSFGAEVESSSKTYYTFEHTTGLLSFASLPEKGIRPLRIRTTPLHMSEIVLRQFLDSDWYQYFITHGIEFPAQRWIKDFDAQLEKGGRWHKEIYEWFRPEVQKVLKIHASRMKNK